MSDAPALEEAELRRRQEIEARAEKMLLDAEERNKRSMEILIGELRFQKRRMVEFAMRTAVREAIETGASQRLSQGHAEYMPFVPGFVAMWQALSEHPPELALDVLKANRHFVSMCQSGFGVKGRPCLDDVARIARSDLFIAFRADYELLTIVGMQLNAMNQEYLKQALAAQIAREERYRQVRGKGLMQQTHGRELEERTAEEQADFHAQDLQEMFDEFASEEEGRGK